MAAKKATSRKRSTTTKSSKTTRSTAKSAPKRRAATKTARAEYTPPVRIVPAAESPVVPAAAAPAEPAAPAAPTPRAVAEARPGRSIPSGDQPSRYTGDRYLHATGPQPTNGKTPHPGKWLIFVSRSRVDALWETIRRAVERGRLGHAAKVSTALPDPAARDPKKHIIAVYTGDESDAADVRRVREVLRGLGVTWRIPYKSDAAAKAGQNDEMTGGPATKYYE